MPKDHFQFKQFGVSQEGATLKVCTDSCLFGAWAAKTAVGKKVLDIGTGTGLLALMYAQEHLEAHIIALEIDASSALLAKRNFEASHWNERLDVINSSLQVYSEKASESFDLIICNPPFFENQLLSTAQNKNLAKHDVGMTQEELLFGICCLLTTNGKVCVLLPPAEAVSFTQLALKEELHLNALVKVRNTMEKEPFRHMMLFERERKILNEKEIVIYNEDRTYTASFIDLLKGYYLYL